MCPGRHSCSQWAKVYIKYCLCTVKDGVSLTLGLMSVLSWGVAEVPQIVTNYRNKQAEGLSMMFLLMWTAGDVFNLLGCYLEPTTLPTQYYTAALYTFTTLILATQTIYFGHIYHRLRPYIVDATDQGAKFHQSMIVDDDKHTNDPRQARVASPSIPVNAPLLAHYGSYEKGLYFTSARSLSTTPISTGSFMSQARSFENTNPTSILKPNFMEPLLSENISRQSAPSSKTKNMLCVISAATFILTTLSNQFSSNNKAKMSMQNGSQGVVIFVGRKLLETSGIISLGDGGEAHSGIGTILGWVMAAIYMGGRLPQIYLNIKRGHVEGLNPLMFMFALVGNITYVASILVNSLEWSKLQPNLPWLVDAGGCVILDTFILLQWVHFTYWKAKSQDEKNDDP